MKSYFFIAGIFLITFRVWSQDFTDSSFQLTKIPADGIILNKGWKFHAGDNPQWAKPEFDDRQWEPVNPTLELHHLPQVKKPGIGWFRLKLQVDSSLTGKALAMVIASLGASEIYLNGKLIYRQGTVSKDYNVERTRSFFALPIALKLADQSTQVLAVRYSFNKKNLYLKFTNIPPCLSIVVKDVNQTFTDNSKGEGFLSILRSIQLSFYLPLGVLILFLYYSFKNRKEYLYFGVFCLSFFFGILLQILGLLPLMTASQSMIIILASISMYIVGALSLINGTHLLYKLHKNWVFKFIVIYALLIIPFFFISNDWSSIFLLFFALAIVFEFLRLNFQAIRRHRPGAWILFTTASLLILATICMVWLLIIGNIYLHWVVFSIVYVIPAIGLSLFTAGDFARTGLTLQLKVVEVEQLSAKTISQEKEKQQILTAQNETLETQVSERTLDLKQSLDELKSTQVQLIQSEKMASLGELTAGIAHEIQNPLNFVNNFSEVNKELLAELKDGIEKKNYDEVNAIADNVIDNEEKINHHGKRADAIVKGMLQHSKTSSGQKELTNINPLADEYLRLSYHGFRAKDKAFNATMQTDFDKSIGIVSIIPQEIGRVLLNLYNNAFYAVAEKKKSLPNDYEPTVAVTTQKINGKVEIRVADNGNGVAQKVIDKIFQPFFTTKPTGQGTGLGLSLSYDIIKAHGGEIKVETKEGEGSEFIIQLPFV